MWEIEYTDDFEAWWNDLDEDDQERLSAAVDFLADHGPSAPRPKVGEIKGSRFDPQMRELREGTMRVLFMWDPRRTAILLLGGDKRGTWNAWYTEAIPAADALYDQHLRDLGPSDDAK